MNDAPVIAVHALACARDLHGRRAVLEIPELSVCAGTVTLLTGTSDSGKDLLLRVLGLLEVPDAGEVIFEGAATSKLSEEARAQLRDRRCGYVFESPFLLPGFSVIENIAMPLFKVCQMEPDEARTRADEVLDFAGLQHVATATDVPAALQHRVALARALAGRPAVVFVEHLDALIGGGTGEEFRALLQRAAKELGVAVVASCGIEQGAQGARRVHLNAGRLAPELMQ